MAQARFESVLDMPATDFERPPPIPPGTYGAAVKGLPEWIKSDRTGTEGVQFAMALLQAADDVDKEALEAIGGIAEKVMPYRFYVTEKSGYRLREFLEDLGIEVQGKSLRAASQEANGRQCLLSVRHTPRQDGKGFYSEIASTAPLAE